MIASALCVLIGAVPIAIPQDDTAIGNVGNIIDGSLNPNITDNGSGNTIASIGDIDVDPTVDVR
ncbi:hypothetical protein PRZ48_006753 [Zasmidium cellare]|uniref:Uncharacterized protein n=1 Tax=Zasmidium cellare TaxID=395010 RepID=A0ABR0EHG2_ZASCE|nr:hypothetical protein PRZ48_006753 [Zasmidium cellare]